MQKIIFIVICLFMAGIVNVYSEDASTSSSPILMLDTSSAKGVGIANNSSMQYGQVGFILQNPGIIGSIDRINADLTYLPWLFDTGYFIGNVVVPLPVVSLGASIAAFSTGDFDYTLRDGNLAPDKLSMSEFLINVGAGKQLINNEKLTLSAGVSVKLISSKIYTYSGTGFAVDAGAVGLYSKWIYGLAIQNIGVGQKFVSETSSLPFKIRAGLGYKVSLISPDHLFLPLLEYVNDGISKFNLGLEYAYKEMLFIRTGYSASSKQDVFSGLSAGLGIRYFGINFNYGLKIKQEIDTSLLHTFSIGYGF